MSGAVEWEIPPSVSRWLAAAPVDRGIAVLLRHSVRPPFEPGDTGYSLSITAEGARLAFELGAMLRGRLRSLHSSPLPRCRQTAEQLAKGSEVALSATPDRLLGDPGAFVVNSEVAGRLWLERGHEWMMNRLVSQRDALPGMARPDVAAKKLARHMLALAMEPGAHVFVTHDSLVTATAAWWLGRSLTPEDWPEFLEGAFFWRSGDGIEVRYRGYMGTLCADFGE